MSVTLRIWFGSSLVALVAVLLSTVCGGVVRSAQPNRSGVDIDQLFMNHTYGQFCWANDDCNAYKYEHCSPYDSVCMCVWGAFYDFGMHQCNPCPNDKQRCSECCPASTHQCSTSQFECTEREWWSEPAKPPAPQTSPFTITVSLIASISITLLLWHCCCRKPLHKPVDRPVLVAVSPASPEGVRDVEPQRVATIAVEAPPPRFSVMVEEPPPSYTESMKNAYRPN